MSLFPSLCLYQPHKIITNLTMASWEGFLQAIPPHKRRLFFIRRPMHYASKCYLLYFYSDRKIYIDVHQHSELNPFFLSKGQWNILTLHARNDQRNILVSVYFQPVYQQLLSSWVYEIPQRHRTCHQRPWPVIITLHLFPFAPLLSFFPNYLFWWGKLPLHERCIVSFGACHLFAA